MKIFPALILIAALLLPAAGGLAVTHSPSATAPMLVSISLSQNPVPSTGQVTITAVFSDPQGAGDIRRYYFGFSNCSNATGEAYLSNFERNFGNYFGLYSYTGGIPGIANYNDPSGCSGGQYTGASPWIYTVLANNAPGTATLLSQSWQTSGNTMSVSWVLQMNNFPVGNYNAYYMVEDYSLTWQTGSANAEWWRSIAISVRPPPTATPTATGTPKPTATKTPTPTNPPLPTKTPTPTAVPNDPPSLVSISMDHRPALRNDVITLKERFYDPQGGGTIQRVYLGISDCTLASGDDSSSNFERNLSNFFGGVFYPLTGLTMMAKNDQGSACTGGIYGLSPWSSIFPLANSPGNLSLESVHASVNGNYLETDWRLALHQFPPGVYSLYSMGRDEKNLWHSGSTPQWTRAGADFEVLPPPQPHIDAVWLSGLAEPSISIAQGASFRLKIQVSNLASTKGSGENAGIHISFPGQSPDFLAFVSPTSAASPGLLYSESPASPQDPMVSATKSLWAGGETNVLELLIEPQRAGTLEIQIKVAMQQGADRYTDPQNSGHFDQQGEAVLLRSVEVVPLIDPLSRVNYYRSLAGLDPVNFLTAWNDACLEHAAYLAENNLLTHAEDPQNPWYSFDGAAAGQASDLALIQDPESTDSLPVDLWMTSAFHASHPPGPPLAADRLWQLS